MTASSTPRFALGTFSIAGGPPFAGLVVNEQVIAVRAFNEHPDEIGARICGGDTVLGILEDWARNLPLLRRAAAAFVDGPLSTRLQAVAAPIEALRVHAPVEQPRQILMARANYREHVIEMLTAFGRGEGSTVEERRADIAKMVDKNSAEGDPFLWVKLQSCVAGPYDTIELSPTTSKPDWELELAVVIGRAARHVTPEKALDYVAGYCIANDVSARDLIMRTYLGSPANDWTAGKCSPGFMPMGPYLVPTDFVPDPQALDIVLKHNGKIMQDAKTSDLLHDVPRLVAYASRHVQLLPGDVISTGSPDGNGLQFGIFLRDGDEVEGSISGLGVQRNRFVAPAGQGG